MRIAHKVNFVNTGQRPFINFINQIDAVIFPADDFRLHHHSITSGPLINLQNTLHVVLSLCLTENRPRRQLHLTLQHCIVNMLIPVKHPLIDNRIFHHVNHQCTIRRHVKSHILKQPGRIQLFQGVIQPALRNLCVFFHIQISHNGFIFNTI